MYMYGKEYFVQQYKLLVVNFLKSVKTFKLGKMDNIGKLQRELKSLTRLMMYFKFPKTKQSKVTKNDTTMLREDLVITGGAAGKI